MSNIYRKSTINSINKKFKLLNIKKITPETFMNYRVVLSLSILILFLFFNEKGYIYGPILAIIIYVLFDLILDIKIKHRRDKLNFEAIFYFQVLAISLESGKNLQGAIELTCKSIDNEISTEFKRALDEIKLGRSLIESLNNMKERIPSEEINTVILNITQSTIFGNNIIDSLNNQIEYLRDKKILDIKATINKMPLKISIISVIFIIPIILLLLLGPVIINYLINM